ncbi:molybdopterin-dependent oxidoreductase [uncultured Pelagimonas sp.]|uniref:molybdopterin-dependent oxidoreductase n=1 Tax=uncultured Pelagimonas sp. TaxID=1618102 RepID=UPI002629D347|nr:molybdopterin-dependent oxidoreductase [uncultured Pelagimonas sp.]
MTKLLVVLLTLIVSFTPFLAAADQTQTEPVLFIQQGVSSEPIALTLADLQSLPQTTFKTSTIWTSGVSEFSGVALSQLMAPFAVNQGVIRARAANDYAVDIPISSLTDTAPIVAYRMDGDLIPRRGKGPLWIVFPYDMDAAFRTETVYSQSIWQLKSLDVVD